MWRHDGRCGQSESKNPRKGVTVAVFAREIGMNPSTFYRKLATNGLDLTVGQMHKAVEVLSLTKNDAVLIFLAG